jgi:hypothetical protein
MGAYPAIIAAVWLNALLLYVQDKNMISSNCQTARHSGDPIRSPQAVFLLVWGNSRTLRS